MAVSSEQIRHAFRVRMKTLSCPHCNTRYSDDAIAWSEAWLEGRHDAVRDLGGNERDGPVKLKCQACGGKAVTNVFFETPKAI